MSIILKGIDLPTEDDVIFIGITKTGKCGMKVRQNEYLLMDYAQAIQIPKGHGDIKDIKAIFEDLNKYQIEYNADINEVIVDAPTILEAEEER